MLELDAMELEKQPELEFLKEQMSAGLVCEK